MKRFALRGMVILMAVVMVCMFFSGTVRTMTMPKIKIVTAKQGRLEQTQKVSAKLVFPEQETMTLKAADSFDITVQRVYVRIGSEVRQGDVVFSASIVGYEEKMEALQKEYDEKAAQLAELERKNAQRVRVTTRTGLYQQMIEARAALHECTIDMRVLLMIEGISLTPQPDEGEQIDWIQEAVNQNASAELIEIVRQVIELQNTAAEAETVFFESGKDYSLTVTDETWNYISERDKLLDEMEQIDRQIIDLKLLERQMSAVEAPRDGYISAISIKGGESYPVSAAAYAMNAEGSMPVLRADISDTQMDIVPGAAAVIQRGSQDINTEVGTIGFDESFLSLLIFYTLSQFAYSLFHSVFMPFWRV